ncbi:MAG: S-methyl-5'-thioadenosine phosphorylase [Candidatus Nanopelagicales bacterium]
MTVDAEFAVIGGSGLYHLTYDVVQVDVPTPYGAPTAPVSLATIGSARVAFLPRHGARHEFPPHAVNYRANIDALRQLGVTRVFAPCAVGSLRTDLGPGSLVVPDQLVDRTHGRAQTFHDRFDGAPAHVEFADPYCPVLHDAVIASAAQQGWAAVDHATMVIIDGPRFSTRAESRFFASQGWDLVNMTGQPEAVLAREAGLCYTPIALVTDLDAGLVTGGGVSVAEALAVFAAHTERLRGLLVTVLTTLAAQSPSRVGKPCGPVSRCDPEPTAHPRVSG